MSELAKKFLYLTGTSQSNDPITLSHHQRALLNSIVFRLQEMIGSNSALKFMQSRWIMIQPDEKVPPTAAERSISVYLSAFGAGDNMGHTRKEEYEVTVALTCRKKAIPSDMRGIDLYTDASDNNTISIIEIAEAIVESIDGRLEIIEKANSLISKGNPFSSKPLFLTPNTDLLPKEVGPEHFYTQPTSKGRQRQVENLEGYLIQIPFGGATRFRNTLEY